jgi:hypothetical protein
MYTCSLIGVSSWGVIFPTCKAMFHHSSQVGSGTTESTCHCFHPLCTSKWFNHLGLHPLQAQVSIKEKNTPTLGYEGHSSQKTNHTSAPVHVVEEISHKSPTLLAGRQQLSQQVGLIFMSADITSPPFVIGHSTTDKVVCNAL